jgi:methionyl-tRNA formyltransferase
MKPPETRAALAELAPDLIVVAAYGRILPPSILELPTLGCVNVHASLLPRHRGASPIAHALLAGDATTGVAIMRMEEGLDTGPVYGQREIAVPADATCGSLTGELATLGAQLLVELLPDILSGKTQARPQPADGATYAGLLRKEDGLLDFSRPAVELERRVRALSPWPGAYAFKGDLRVQVLRAHVDVGSGPPAAVLAAGAEGVVVGCGEGALVLDEVKPAGKAAMRGSAWAAGRGVVAGQAFDLAAGAIDSRSPTS